MTFSDALVILKAGQKVARKGWNGKNMWLRICRSYSDPHFKVTETPEAEGTLMDWIGMKTATNTFVPWLASQSDLLTDDWEIVP